MAHCRFTIAFKADVTSNLYKKLKYADFFRCKASCGRVSHAATSAIYNQVTGTAVPAKDTAVCPMLAGAAAAAAAAQKAHDEKMSEAAKATSEAIVAVGKGKRPRQANAEDNPADSDPDAAEPASKKWTEKTTGLSDDLLDVFLLSFKADRWQAILRSIKGRSSADVKLDALSKKIDDAKKAKADESARTSIRLLISKAAPIQCSDLRSIAGALASMDHLRKMQSPPSIPKSSMSAEEPGTILISDTISDSAASVLELAGRKFLQLIFLELLEEVKGEATPYVMKDGGKRSTCPSVERFAAILLQGHAIYASRLPSTWRMPPLMTILITRWSIPCRDNIQAWNALPLFVSAGVLDLAARANPEDAPLLAALTALDTYIRHTFTTWREKFVNSTTNKDLYKKIETAAQPAPNRPSGADAAKADAARARAAAAAAAAALHTPPAARPSAQFPKVSVVADSNPQQPVFHSPNRYLAPLPPAPAASGRAGTVVSYASCMAQGCTNKPPSGTSKYPYCVDHAPPEQKAQQAANKARYDAASKAASGAVTVAPFRR